MTYFLLAVIFFLIGMILAGMYFIFRLLKIIFRFIDEVTLCLDTLDNSYMKIGEILKTPIGMDDPFVRSVLSEINQAQNAVLVVANRLTSDWFTNVSFDEEDDEEEENE